MLCSACGQQAGVRATAIRARGPAGRARACARPCALRLARDQGAPDRAKSKTPALDDFGRDLTADAREGRIDPVVGRDAEIEQTIETLARRRKNNVVLIGEAGVGKTAIAEGLALRIAEGDVDDACRHAAWSRSTSPAWSRAASSAASSSSA